MAASPPDEIAVAAGSAVVGRPTELAALAAAVDAVAAGGSRVLLLSGEPGIGKTALLQCGAAAADRAGLRVISGRAAEQEEDVPFGLVVDALDDELDTLPPARRERLRPDLATALPSLRDRTAAADGVTDPVQRLALNRALRSFVDELAADGPLAIVLDDLHWADEASLDWVLHLMRRPTRAPHLLLLAVRPVAPLGLLLEAQRNSVPGEHLEIGPLSRTAAAELLSDVESTARRDRYLDEAGGNPLFLGGLARLTGDDDRLPATVLAAVGLEVSALDREARALLEGASVAGDPFDADLALDASDLGPDRLDVLDRLVTADLVRPTGGRSFAFRHPLVRRAVSDAMPAAARIEAHARTAIALTARGAPLEVRAHHVERSARPGDATAATVL
ncbi:MAG: AAA family ATPase, partial [Patulibacter sp.]|nr:AAA family ATPase [Patulibacter sp.]